VACFIHANLGGRALGSTKQDKIRRLQVRHYKPISMPVVHEHLGCYCAALCAYCSSHGVCPICPSNRLQQANRGDLK